MTGARKRRLLLLCLMSALIQANNGYAKVRFNPAMLEKQSVDNDKVDLSAFEELQQLPGTYRVEVVMNNRRQETRDVTFFRQDNEEGGQTLQPCLSADVLASYGVNVARYPLLQQENGCADLSQIADARARLDVNAQQLILSFPQAELNHSARDAVPPDRWDEGISALMLNYRFSGAHSEALQAHRRNNDSQFLSLRPGINVGPWRLRNYSTWSRSRHSDAGWDRLYTRVQRGIIPLQAQLTLGESTSPTDIYDSVSFRGVQLASDDDMLPDSLKGYAPIVRGIARSHAQVNVYQNGNIIYQTYVAPGAFAINDIYPTGSSGDLYVTIRETDGSEQQLVVPFASVPVLQREGYIKYSLTGGEYRNDENHTTSKMFVQGTAIAGLQHGFTLYGGTQQADSYHSLVAGVGRNFGQIGALSLDATVARSKLAGRQDTQHGHVWRLRYGKNFIGTGTNLALAGFRYATRDYYSLDDVLDSYGDSQSYFREQRRQRAEMLLTQNLWSGAGSLTINAVDESFWDNDRRLRSINIGYNNSWKGIGLNLNYSYNRNTQLGFSGKKSGREEQIVALSLNMALSDWSSNTWASYQVNSTRHGSTSQTVGLNGTALEDNNLGWSVRQGYTNRNGGSLGSADIDYRGGYGQVDAGYAWDRNSRRLNYGISGALVAHQDGVTLSQPLGETVALVKSPGVGGASVVNQTGVITDFRGYTLVPYVRPYRVSELTLDPLTLPETVELAQSSSQVIPTRGAVVRADFSGRLGQRALFTLVRTNGQPVPFGATVRPEDDNSDYSSIVGSDGEVWLSGLASRGKLLVNWGSGADKQCRASFALPDSSEEILLLKAICR
ncbi:fimbria/pilus outer membrane usher protein [Mixta intestinalis]|uniref:Outer membrane usher protein FimD n=1 Tax=Mixta intestinalis TaxID=1615494 RepID=A0A6P1Q443_9GAMM|nr:fimbria/pilus outer membrane usher protein [Mixta intestinalis]QHM73746.1 Outer membrane usher protein FimD [Mixta intestinalis]